MTTDTTYLGPGLLGDDVTNTENLDLIYSTLLPQRFTWQINALNVTYFGASMPTPIFITSNEVSDGNKI